MNCPACGQSVAADFRFCGSCGHAIEHDPDPWAGAVVHDVEGERRQLTVMFCDLVGSTPLSQRLDPEDLRDVIRAFQELCGRAIEPFDGSIAQLLGDGVLVYFGYPLAHEDDAALAVNAALGVLAGLDELNRRLAGWALPAAERLQVRIGIHTGPVVVDDVGMPKHQVRLALGETVNVASRLQQVAAPDTLVISEASRRLLDDAFVLESPCIQALKGVEDSIETYRVLRALRSSERTPPRARTPLVGRERERRTLLARFEGLAEDGLATVLVEGEPGIGKSRLVQELRERLAGAPHVWLECSCSHNHENSALFPVAGMLERALQLRAEANGEERFAILERGLEAHGAGGVVVPFADLLSLPVPKRLRGPPQSPEARRRRELEAVVDWLAILARRSRVVLFVEDLHWVDPSTLELLSLIRERASGSAILLLCAVRPGGGPPWPESPDLLHLNLEPLTDEEALLMARAVAGDRHLADEIGEELVVRTDRVPLFVEELTKAVLEGSLETSGLDSVIPTTLQDSLMARLDRLGRAKALAQFAAVIGREFPHELLAAAGPWDGPTLEHELAQLVASDLVRPQRASDGRSVYAFKHALIRDTAYGSLLRERRRWCHARVAKSLEEHFEGRAEARPEVIGRHYREAGNTRRAIACYQRAAEQAFERSAHAESMNHCREGIRLIGEAPQQEERARLELPLRIALGATLIAARGYGNAEVAETHARARELCRDVGAGPELYQAIGGLYLFYQGRMEFKPAAELAGQLLALGNEAGDPFVRQWGHFFSSVPLFYWGKYEASMEHLERALRDEATGEIPEWFRHEHEVRVSACSYGALALWALGFPDQAQQRMAEAVALGRRSSHPFNLAFALSWAALGYQLRGEPEKVLDLSAEATAICGEQGFPAYLGLAQALHGWARTREARDPEGIDELREGLRRSATTGTRTEAPRAMGILAEAYQNLERWNESLATIDAALAVSQQHGCPYWDAELLRLRGEALWRRDADAADEALVCIEHAVALAREQKARGLELRAVLSAARCLDALGRQDDGREALEGVVEAFTEGDDLPDLREARGLVRAWRS